MRHEGKQGAKKEMERDLIQLFTAEQLVFVLAAMLTLAIHAAIQKTTRSCGKLEGCHQWEQPFCAQIPVNKCSSRLLFYTSTVSQKSHSK